MKHYSYTPDFISIVNANNDDAFYIMRSEYSKLAFKNPTLATGQIGYALATLCHYERTSDKKYLIEAETIIKRRYFWNGDKSILHGQFGWIITALYYYSISKDIDILNHINSNIENLLIDLKFDQSKYYTPLGLGTGTTEILIMLLIVQHFYQNKYVDHLLTLLIECENYMIDRNPNNPVTLECRSIRLWLKELMKNSYCHATTESASFNYLKESSTITSANIEPAIIPLINFLFTRIEDMSINIDLDFEKIAKGQIEGYFPRTISEMEGLYKYENHLKSTAIQTVKDFINTFNVDLDNVYELFRLERFIFEYEDDLRCENEEFILDRNDSEMRKSMLLLSLSTHDFLDKYFECADDIRIIELKYYTDFEERNFELDPPYIISIKPQLSLNNKLMISEHCLQGLLRLALTVKKYNKPIKGSELISCLNNTENKLSQDKIEYLMIKALRKLVLLGLLRAHINADAEKQSNRVG